MGAYDCDCMNNLEYDRHEKKAQLSQEGTTSDTISRQAAIDSLAKIVPYVIDDVSTESYTNGLTDAYNLICQLPPAQPEPTDEQVADYCKRRCLHIVTADVFQSTHLTHKVSFGDKDHVWIDGKQYISLRRFQEKVKEAEPQKGEWIRRDCGLDVECKCSVCGYKDFVEKHDTYWFKRNYCPNCGAKMTTQTKQNKSKENRT